MRDRRTFPTGPVVARREFAPGDLVFEFARRWRWPIGAHNLMVEGTRDVSYFSLANLIYKDAHGLNLMGNDFSVFAVGEREQGGTIAIQTKLVALRDVIRADPVDTNGNRFRIVCLVDNDTAGQKLRSVLTSREVGFVENRDVFLLHRRFPMATRDPTQYGKLLMDMNRDCKGMACEMEDLLSRELLGAFVAEKPGRLRRPPIFNGEAHHYEFEDHVKTELLRFAEENAILDDVSSVRDVLMALRYAVGLCPEGC